jgi:hypothetical protein
MPAKIGGKRFGTRLYNNFSIHIGSMWKIKRYFSQGKVQKGRKSMKKRNLWLVILALALVFGMMVSCGEELIDDDGDDGDDWEWGDIIDESFFGTYKVTYGTNNITETIVFEKDKFTISDDAKTSGVLNGDFLEFNIQEFDEVTTIPDVVKDIYSEGFIFKGNITDGKPINTNIYGSQTGPGLTQKDIDDETLLKMYIFYDPETGNFVRTAFVKNSASIGNIIQVNAEDILKGYRVYTKE